MSARCVAVVCCLLYSPLVQAKLEIKNVQAAHGQFGGVRRLPKVVPGEELVFRFQTVGLTTGQDGHSDATMTVTLMDKNKKTVVTEKTPIKLVLPLGGDMLPGIARLAINSQAAPGEYQLELKIEDKLSGDSAVTERAIVVQPASFSMINPRFYYDAAGQVPAPPGGLVGQTLYFRCQVVGIEPAEKLSLSLTMRVFDLDGKEVLNPASVVKVDEESASRVKKLTAIAFDRSLLLNRSGEFVVKITVVDEVSKKEVKFETPLAVTGP